MRTIGPTKTNKQQPLGRVNTYHGMYVAIVKDNSDVQKMGRLRVWIPEFGSLPDDESAWVLVSYSTPFAGATSPYTQGKNIQQFEETQTSYGLWMVPPDLGNQVLVMFANGDVQRGFFIGCVFQQFMNHMIPGVRPSVDNYQQGGKYIPVAEYNKWDKSIINPDTPKRPYHKTKFKGLGNQGLITDNKRGTSESSARRETPSEVFGILTPGPIESGTNNTTVPGESTIRRKGGSAFYMDDKVGNEQIVLTTKSGAKLQLDETNGFVYVINRDGTSWISMDEDGNVDIFSAKSISMRAQKDFNIRADRNVNIEAGQNIFMKAAKDTVKSTQSFTFNVNNIPETKNVEYYKWTGEGLGEGGHIVTQALGDMYITARENGKILVENNNFDIEVSQQFFLTTVNGGQQFNAKQGLKLTTDGAFDMVAKNSLRMHAGGSANIVGSSKIALCSDGQIGIKASGTVDIKGAAVLAENFSPSGANPVPADAPMKAAKASKPAIKPVNSIINVLWPWTDPETKFIRESEHIKTTVSRMPTFEPCPLHSSKGLIKTPAVLTPYEKTSNGSSSTTVPEENVVENVSTAIGDEQSASNVTPIDSYDQLKCELRKHEGVKTVVYKDSVGLNTTGVGHLLTASEQIQYPHGSTVSVVELTNWFNADIGVATRIAQVCIGEPTYSSLGDARQRACINLAFNLGYRLRAFTAFKAAMVKGDYNAAAAALKDSKWYSQVGVRGPDIIQMIQTNTTPIKCNII